MKIGFTAEQQLLQDRGHTMMDFRASAPLFRKGLESDTYVFSGAAGIDGGTAQVQRKIVAHRVPGMPRADGYGASRPAPSSRRALPSTPRVCAA